MWEAVDKATGTWLSSSSAPDRSVFSRIRVWVLEMHRLLLTIYLTLLEHEVDCTLYADGESPVKLENARGDNETLEHDQ